MANSKQAQKRARQADKQRMCNAGKRTKLRTYIKKTVQAILSGDKATAQETYKSAVPVIDKMSNNGIIHKNKAARHKSRLSSQIKEMKSA